MGGRGRQISECEANLSSRTARAIKGSPISKKVGAGMEREGRGGGKLSEEIETKQGGCTYKPTESAAVHTRPSQAQTRLRSSKEKEKRTQCPIPD